MSLNDNNADKIQIKIPEKTKTKLQHAKWYVVNRGPEIITAMAAVAGLVVLVKTRGDLLQRWADEEIVTFEAEEVILPSGLWNEDDDEEEEV